MAPASSGAPGAKGAHRSLREGNSQRHVSVLAPLDVRHYARRHDTTDPTVGTSQPHEDPPLVVAVALLAAAVSGCSSSGSDAMLRGMLG